MSGSIVAFPSRRDITSHVPALAERSEAGEGLAVANALPNASPHEACA
jgi:hypothetical protein